MDLGAKGVINRKDFNCWGQLPTVNSDEYKTWFGEVRKFGKAFPNLRTSPNQVLYSSEFTVGN